MKKRLVMSIIAGLCASVLFLGCGKKKEETPEIPEPITVVDEPQEPQEPEETVVDEPEETVADTTQETREGQALSPLTGEWIDEELAKQRPVSCMIGNTQNACPQFGVGEADIIYEAPVEGGLTRLMGIYQDYTGISKLGSVRSSRLYYAYYSLEFDAVYLHYGQASYATNFLSSGQIDDLNGLEYAVDQAVIYRDSTKSAPHNAYATGEGLAKGIALKGYKTAYEEDYAGHYLFAPEDEPVELTGQECQDALFVRPGYPTNKPWFEYNATDGLYYRNQYGGKHIDGNNGDQLAVKNILLQNSNVRTLDDYGYLEIDTTGEGTGWYVTNGKAMEVTWKRGDVFSPTHYYDADGTEITLNPGKTWVCIIDNSKLDKVQFSQE